MVVVVVAVVVVVVVVEVLDGVGDVIGVPYSAWMPAMSS